MLCAGGCVGSCTAPQRSCRRSHRRSVTGFKTGAHGGATRPSAPVQRAVGHWGVDGYLPTPSQSHRKAISQSHRNAISQHHRNTTAKPSPNHPKTIPKPPQMTFGAMEL